MRSSESRRRTPALPALIAAGGLGAASLLVLGAVTPAAAQESGVVINEIAQNTGDTDWVELKNTGASAVDVSGWRLFDDSDARDFALGAGSVIEPGGYLVVDVDVDVDDRSGFGLGRADEVRLFDGAALVDAYAWNDHAATTYARCADGLGEFIVSAEPTRGAANACEADPATSLRLNEVESSDADGGEDWIELTNIGSAPLDLSGLLLMDTETRSTTIPDPTMLAPGAFHIVGGDDLGFGLGASDQVRIFRGEELIDSYSWTEHAATTYGRYPDGTGAFAITSAPSPGAPNHVVTGQIPAIVINEVESSGGVPGDWIELHNPGEGDVDLSGYVVGDSDPAHRATLPAGSIVAAGGYFIVEEAMLDFGLGSDDRVILLLPDGATVVDERAWTTHAPTTYGLCGDEWGVTTTPTKGAANDCSSPVRINEIESSGGVPGDWVELVNVGTTGVDISGLVISDDDDDHRFVVPAGTTIPAGGHWVADVDAESLGEAGFGLGGEDAVRLFDGDALLDSFDWTEHAPTTYGRCPDGTGDFAATAAPTRGAANACDGDAEAPATAPWPGPSQVRTADVAGTYAENLSGLVFSADGETLWGVQNNPGSLHRLERDGDLWVPAKGWTGGRALHYGGADAGTGNVDAEGVTLGGDGLVYVASERNNDGGGSRPSVLAYAPDAAPDAASLDAHQEWNLAADLPVLGSNSGLEGITWVDSAVLEAQQMIDESTGRVYDAATHPGADGVFFVGVEGTGGVYGYALAGDGTFTRVASFASGFPGVMEVQYEPATGALWVYCDEACGGRTAVFSVDQTGAFAASVVYDRPAGMDNIANEGLAIAPPATCTDGLREVVWADDSSTDGHALRVGAIDCSVDTGPGEPGGPGQPGEADTVGPIDAGALGDADRGGVEVPGTARRGEMITVGTDAALTGRVVEVWLHSRPVLLGTPVVTAGGTVEVTIPADAELGPHRIVVLDAAAQAPEEALIGWGDLRIVDAVDGTAGGGAGGGDTTSLPAAGAPRVLAALLGALALLVVGGALLMRARRVRAALGGVLS